MSSSNGSGRDRWGLDEMPVPRDARGRILPGHSLNPTGRPLGSMSDKTVVANRLLRAHAAKAVRVLVAALNDHERRPWPALHAAALVVTRLGLGAPDSDGGDTSWTAWVDRADAQSLADIMARAVARKAAADGVIEVEALPPGPEQPEPDTAVLEPDATTEPVDPDPWVEDE